MSDKIMTIDAVINQLGSLRSNCAAVARADDAEKIRQADVEACDAAINILFALSEEGIKTADAARDIAYDYRKLAKQYQVLHLRCEVAGKPVHKDGVWHCPACNCRVDPRHSFCHRCGKKLNGEQTNATKRKRI